MIRVHNKLTITQATQTHTPDYTRGGSGIEVGVGGWDSITQQIGLYIMNNQ